MLAQQRLNANVNCLRYMSLLEYTLYNTEADSTRPGTFFILQMNHEKEIIKLNDMKVS